MTLVPRQNVGQPVEQSGVGAIEPVHGLVGVPHHEQVGFVGQHRGEQPELGGVHVLHLVDEEVAGAPADGVGELAIACQRVGAGDDQVVEVEQAPACALALVLGVRVRHLLGADARSASVPPRLGLVAVGGDQPGLGPPDLPVEGAGAARVAGGHVGQQATPVGQELRQRAPAELPVLAEQAQRGAVERAGLDPRDAQ